MLFFVVMSCKPSHSVSHVVGHLKFSILVPHILLLKNMCERPIGNGDFLLILCVEWKCVVLVEDPQSTIECREVDEENQTTSFFAPKISTMRKARNTLSPGTNSR